MAGGADRVRIEPWSEGDLDLLRRINIPEMKRHLGGPETEEQVLARHERYLRFGGGRQGCMFRVVALPDGVAVGSVGYWERDWHGEPVYEIGWSILPEHQGRGLATAALLAVVDEARARRDRRYAHAYPSVDNAASNAVCRKAGFEFRGETDFEFPKGRLMRSNDWRLDLTDLS
ncbi:MULTISPECIES: GNAT family N-acetyltransferase [unclassified Plantactinospora]|uniref:GNAT family N-acetyltransferase n=1 Tax=unclassified Plantactinospora TaxID=2631981 RepID=UPI000D16FAFE|nr:MULTISPECIES: GNAT family N-acetyltransferase [unclassified Plantactinospora]AVT30043.1 GNAT family N-acetyltransferase [Plantactinospora sp. BC1]AVT36555.1 GNAT family N-acetyltransferase [Plantactinospora sp. BB1]